MSPRHLSGLSVAMPYWCRQAELDRSLAAYAQLYSGMEISICDYGSPAPVRAPGCIITSLPRKNIGLNPCVPFNIAVRASSRPFVLLTNPEIEHRTDVIGAMFQLLEGPLDYVTARCLDADGTWLAGPEVDYNTGGRMPVPPGAHFHFCALLHRNLFERAGGFDEAYRYGRSCEDNDWLWRLNAAGARFITCPQVVHHTRTIHAYAGSHHDNRALLTAKWGHMWR